MRSLCETALSKFLNGDTPDDALIGGMLRKLELSILDFPEYGIKDVHLLPEVVNDVADIVLKPCHRLRMGVENVGEIRAFPQFRGLDGARLESLHRRLPALSAQDRRAICLSLDRIGGPGSAEPRPRGWVGLYSEQRARNHAKTSGHSPDCKAWPMISSAGW